MHAEDGIVEWVSHLEGDEDGDGLLPHDAEDRLHGAVEDDVRRDADHVAHDEEGRELFSELREVLIGLEEALHVGPDGSFTGVPRDFDGPRGIGLEDAPEASAAEEPTDGDVDGALEPI